MNLIIGLGNPGEKYAHNRHNVGYLVVEVLLTKRLPGVVAQKTNVFMNASGKAVKKLMESYKMQTNNLYIIHDDLDIKLGGYKIQFAKGPKDHKGLLSIYDSLGTNDFWHVRIGVDNRQDQKITGEEYVLEDFKKDEEKIIVSVIKKLVEDLDGRFKG